MRQNWFARGSVALLMALTSPSIALAQDALPTCEALVASVAPGTVYDGADYDAVRRGCTLNWIENNGQRSLTWRHYADDFAAPTLTRAPHGGLVLTSQMLPDLVDIDQNGTRDLLVFTRIGRVNGDFDIFLTDTDPRAFVHAGTVNGAFLARDRDGALVAQGRNGSLAFFRFFKVTGQTVVPLFDVDPQDTCRVTQHENGPQPNSALIDHYCAVHENPDAPSRQSLLESESEIAIVPAGTLFYCQLDVRNGRREVMLSYASEELRYSYGAIGEVPELTLSRGLNSDERGITADGETWESLRNGAYTYMISFTQTDQTVDVARLRVFQDGRDAPVFEAVCDPQMTYAGGL